MSISWSLHGIRADFFGQPVAEFKDRPVNYHPGMCEIEREDLLPAAVAEGVSVSQWKIPDEPVDPFVIYKGNRIVFEWPEGVEPSWVDVMRKCQELKL